MNQTTKIPGKDINPLLDFCLFNLQLVNRTVLEINNCLQKIKRRNLFDVKSNEKQLRIINSNSTQNSKHLILPLCIMIVKSIINIIINTKIVHGKFYIHILQ